MPASPTCESCSLPADFDLLQRETTRLQQETARRMAALESTLHRLMEQVGEVHMVVCGDTTDPKDTGLKGIVADIRREMTELQTAKREASKIVLERRDKILIAGASASMGMGAGLLSAWIKGKLGL